MGHHGRHFKPPGHGTTENQGEAGQSTLTGHSNKNKNHSNNNWSSTQWLGHLLLPGDVGGFLSPDSRQSAGLSASTEELPCIKQLLGDARSVLCSWCSWWFILILQGPLQVHNEKVNQWEVNADNLQRRLKLNAKHPSEAVKLWGQRWVCGRARKNFVFVCSAARSSHHLYSVFPRYDHCSFWLDTIRKNSQMNLEFATDEFREDTTTKAQVLR